MPYMQLMTLIKWHNSYKKINNFLEFIKLHISIFKKKSKIKVIYLITINASPILTASPGSTKISSTVPDHSA